MAAFIPILSQNKYGQRANPSNHFTRLIRKVAALELAWFEIANGMQTSPWTKKQQTRVLSSEKLADSTNSSSQRTVLALVTLLLSGYQQQIQALVAKLYIPQHAPLVPVTSYPMEFQPFIQKTWNLQAIQPPMRMFSGQLNLCKYQLLFLRPTPFNTLRFAIRYPIGLRYTSGKLPWLNKGCFGTFRIGKLHSIVRETSSPHSLLANGHLPVTFFCWKRACIHCCFQLRCNHRLFYLLSATCLSWRPSWIIPAYPKQQISKIL